MFKFFKNRNFIKSPKILGVHYFHSSESEIKIHYVLLSRRGSQISIEQNQSLTGEWEMISKDLPQNLPVYLSFDGKGVLHKKITEGSESSLVQQVIPNANDADFLANQFSGAGNTSFVSIARNDLIDAIIKQFTEKKFPVIGINISPFVVVKLLNLFPELPSEINTGTYRVTCNNEKNFIEGFQKENDTTSEPLPYFIGAQPLLPVFLIPYYHALTYYLGDEEELSCQAVSELKEDYEAKRIFSLCGWGALLFVFVLLLINTFLFSTYSKEKQQLEGRVSNNSKLIKNLKVLKEEFIWKEKFMAQNGITPNSFISYYADQIALSIPEEITLTKMEIHPLISKVKKAKEIELAPNRITIEGLAEDNMNLNNWVKKLKERNWIKDVSIINYSKEKDDEIGIFSIEITLLEGKLI